MSLRAWLLTPLVLLLSFSVNADDWRHYVKANDRVNLDLLFPRIDQANRQDFHEMMQEYDELARIKTLLASDNQPISSKELEGDWRCRSTQVDNLGVYVYSYFKCNITSDEKGWLLFTKTTGSQLKQGYLFPETETETETETEWVFLGGLTIQGEPYIDYSGISDNSKPEYDVVGKLLNKGEMLLMAFHVGENRYEIYEMLR